MKFSDIETKLEAARDSLEHLFAPIAQKALNAGVTDLAGDAAIVAQQVVDDPTLTTDAAKRDAAMKALAEQLAQQGVDLGENAVAAAAAAALSSLQNAGQTPQPANPAAAPPKEPPAANPADPNTPHPAAA